MLIKFVSGLALLSGMIASPTAYAAKEANKETVQFVNDATTNKETVKSPIANDVEVTREIRGHLVGDDNLSLYAKNVSIVTLNGIVTLRGTVDSDQEKKMVERHARMVVQPSNIRNQLRVAPTGTAR